MLGDKVGGNLFWGVWVFIGFVGVNEVFDLVVLVLEKEKVFDEILDLMGLVDSGGVVVMMLGNMIFIF